MTQKTRLPNKAQWNLQEILIECGKVYRQWDKAIARAEHDADPAMAAMLGRMIKSVGIIQCKATDALHGNYEQEIKE